LLCGSSPASFIIKEPFGMPKKPTNHGKPWTDEDVKQLKEMATHNTPTRVLGIKLQRTPEAVESKAQEIGLSLKPTNQSPYGTKKK
jgi:hypothetical protein